MIHPSRLVVATGQIPPILWGPKQRPYSWSFGERMVWWQWADESRAQSTSSEPPSPTRELEVVWQVMLPPGFMGVTACLQRDPSPEMVHKVSQDPLSIAATLGPMVATKSVSCIMKDEAIGGDLYGHCDHFSGVSGPQWPQTRSLDSGAHHRGHHRLHVMN